MNAENLFHNIVADVLEDDVVNSIAEKLGKRYDGEVAKVENRYEAWIKELEEKIDHLYGLIDSHTPYTETFYKVMELLEAKGVFAKFVRVGKNSGIEFTAIHNWTISYKDAHFHIIGCKVNATPLDYPVVMNSVETTFDAAEDAAEIINAVSRYIY